MDGHTAWGAYPNGWTHSLGGLPQWMDTQPGGLTPMDGHTAYPLIIPNTSSLARNDPPSTRETVSLPALIRSESSSPGRGYGPWGRQCQPHSIIDPPTPPPHITRTIPRMPFSLWMTTLTSFGMKLLAVIGIPIPRLTVLKS